MAAARCLVLLVAVFSSWLLVSAFALFLLGPRITHTAPLLGFAVLAAFVVGSALFALTARAPH